MSLTPSLIGKYNPVYDPVRYHKEAYSDTTITTVIGPQATLTEEQLEAFKAGLVTLEKDPSGKDPHAPGAKLDNGKLQPWLFFSGFANALEEVAKVTTVGAKKYTRNGWVSVENGQERYMEAAMRHLLEYGQGKELDDGAGGTNCLHLAQVCWNLLATLELQLRAAKGD